MFMYNINRILIFILKISMNVFDIAYLTEEQVQMFQSDFKIVADYFVQKRKYHDYSPSQDTIQHVDEVLKLMSVLTADERFEKTVNEVHGQGGVNMCEVLDRIERKGIEKGIKKGIEKGEINAIVRLFKKGILSLSVAAKELSMSEENFKMLL